MAKPRSRPAGAPDDEAPPGGDADDARVFRAAVRDVTPLPSLAQPPAAPRRRSRPRLPPAVEAESLGEADLAGDDSGLAAPGGADALSFSRPGVRQQTLRQLRRGRYPVEDELDLHGLSQSAARDQLAEFISSSRRAGRRCVRVIHGKGYRSGSRGPVLKVAVNTWLKRHPEVLAFTSARAIDGGTGAVYVLLR